MCSSKEIMLSSRYLASAFRNKVRLSLKTQYRLCFFTLVVRVKSSKEVDLKPLLQNIELVVKHEAQELVYVTGCTEGIKVDTSGMTVLMNVEPRDAESLPEDVCKLAVQQGYRGLNMSYDLLSEVWVKAASEHQLLVSIYTVNKIEQLQRCLQLGVDSITTMQVEKLKTLISEQQL